MYSEKKNPQYSPDNGLFKAFHRLTRQCVENEITEVYVESGQLICSM